MFNNALVYIDRQRRRAKGRQKKDSKFDPFRNTGTQSPDFPLILCLRFAENLAIARARLEAELTAVPFS
jgi:hypothetical protein